MSVNIQPEVVPSRRQLSLVRVTILRVGYLIVGLGNAVYRWPDLAANSDKWDLMEGAVNCMLAAMAVFMLLGLRYPRRMLPVMVFEVAWKLLWLTVVALPPWLSGGLDADTRAQAGEILWVVVPLVVVPWGYVLSQFVLAPAEPWRRRPL